MASLSSPGIGSGLDVSGLVNQLVAAERQPATLRLARREAGYQAQLSAFGTLRSALQAFKDAYAALGEADRFAARGVSIGEPATFTATAESTAALAGYDIEVLQLAQTQKLASAPFSGADVAVGTGSLDITAGADTFSVTLENGATLADLAAAINAAEDNPGVRAGLITGAEGTRLVLTAAGSGATQALAVAARDDAGTLAGFVWEADPEGVRNLNEQQAARDGQLRIDGILIESAGNTFDGAIAGVSITALAARPGETTALTVRRDTDGAVADVERFVKAYNKLVQTLGELTRFDPEGEARGPLLGDATARGLESRLRGIIGGENGEGPLRLLSQIGISAATEGTLSLDRDALVEQLEADPAALTALLGENGLGGRLDGFVAGYLGSDGLLTARTEGLDASIAALDAQRARLDERTSALESRLLREFQALDSLLSQLNSTSAFLTQQLANLPKLNGRD